LRSLYGAVFSINNDEFVKSPRIVMPDLISAGDGIFDRHPELIENTGFRLSPE
jgi:hypothetical protein